MKRRKKSRAFLYSFVITTAIFVGLVAALYFSQPKLQVTHLPSQLPNYQTIWGRYVPSQFLYMSFENLTSIRSINSSALSEKALLVVTDPNVTLRSEETRYLLTMTFQTPNASVDVAFVGKEAFGRFVRTFGQSPLVPVTEGNVSLYFTRFIFGKQLQLGWVGLVPDDNSIFYSAGTRLAREAIGLSVGALNGSTASILTRVDIKQLFYISGGASNHLALGIANFPGVVRTAHMTLTTVDLYSAQLRVTNIVAFASLDLALSQYQAVQSAYLSAHQFAVYDSYVAAVAYDPISALKGDVRLVE